MALTWFSVLNPYSKYVRCDMPARAMYQYGVDTQSRNLDTMRWTGQDPVDWVGNGPAIFQIMANHIKVESARRLLHAGVPVYQEVDDNYTRWDSGVANATWTDKMPTHPGQDSVELHVRATPLVDGVICSTPELADIYSKLNPNVVVCRNSVDPDDWIPPLLRLPEHEPFHIVWMASASHRVDQRLVTKALNWAADQPDVRVTIFGPVGISEKVDRVPWTYDPQEYRDTLMRLKPDIGICPLRDTHFSRGKSDLKALEYAMAGAMPVISYLKPYEPWFDKIGSACLCPPNLAPDGWLEVTKWCVENRDKCRDMAKNAREYVMNHRTIYHEMNKSWLNLVHTEAVV